MQIPCRENDRFEGLGGKDAGKRERRSHYRGESPALSSGASR